MTLPSPAESPVESSRGRSDSPRSVSGSSGSLAMPLAPAMSGVHTWAHVELCGIMWNTTWNSAFDPLRDFDHNSTRFAWNKHVELCGIMWNWMWNKPTFDPLRDFDQNST
jgi:hypothetical protein